MDVLVDILLSLLGRSGDALPFGPLREACEGLFRAFAEQVTPQGFADLVRVVQQAPEGQDDEEEDEVFEDEDEDMLAGMGRPPAGWGVSSFGGTVFQGHAHTTCLYKRLLCQTNTTHANHGTH